MIDMRQEALVNWLSTERVDGWINELTGFGTSRDKTMYAAPGAVCDLSDWSLEMLFAADWLAQRIITSLPKDALRKRPKIECGDTKLEKKIRDEYRRLSVLRNAYLAFCWARLYGECAIIPITPSGAQASTPLNRASVTKIDKFEVLDRRYYSPFTFYTKGPKAGEPELYSIGSVTPSVRPYYVIHETRMLRIGGALTTQTERLRRNWRDHSILQGPYEAMRSFAAGFKSLEVLLTDGPQAVYKIKGLAAVLASPNADLFKKKLMALDSMRSAVRAVCIDAEEEFERGAIQFTGLPDSLDRLTEMMAAAVPMPVTKLMGKSPAGQNATGDSDWEAWNGQVGEFQDQELEPLLRELTEMILVTLGVQPTAERADALEAKAAGEEPEEDESEDGSDEETEEPKAKAKPKTDPNDFKIEFPPLRELKPGEQADVRLKVAQTDKTYWDMGLSAEQIFKMRFTEQGWSDSYVPTPEDIEQWDAALEAERAAGDAPPKDALTPTANEAIISVDEARAMLGQPAEEDPEIGKLKVAEYRAKQEASGAEVGSAEGVAETEEKGIAKPPEPSPFGAPPELGPDGKPLPPKPGQKGGAPPPLGKPTPGSPEAFAKANPFRKDEFDPEQPRDGNGMWSASASAVAKAERNEGRAARASARTSRDKARAARVEKRAERDKARESREFDSDQDDLDDAADVADDELDALADEADEADDAADYAADEADEADEELRAEQEQEALTNYRDNLTEKHEELKEKLAALQDVRDELPTPTDAGREAWEEGYDNVSEAQGDLETLQQDGPFGIGEASELVEEDATPEQVAKARAFYAKEEAKLQAKLTKERARLVTKVQKARAKAREKRQHLTEKVKALRSEIATKLKVARAEREVIKARFRRLE